MGNLIALFMTLSLIAAWLTHIIYCLGTMTWGFLIAGALFFPVGIIHGIGLWGAF